MNTDRVEYIYFLGIGGIGMSALASYFAKGGKSVFGYDRTRTPLTDKLEGQGIQIHYIDGTQHIPSRIKTRDKQHTLVVLTPAIPKNNKELNWFEEHGFNIVKRAEALEIACRPFTCIAVAGTHGKTTTSSMIAHILIHSGTPCIAFLGGITNNYNSNFIQTENPEYVVVEADEYDRSFLTLHPHVAVITSIDADHLDIYGNEKCIREAFVSFSKKINADGILFRQSDIDPFNCPDEKTYGLKGSSEFRAFDIEISKGMFHFKIKTPRGTLEQLALQLPGRHNVENATAAVAVCSELGIPFDKISAAIRSYKGVKRRFEILINRSNFRYIDDYAHHPKEIDKTIAAVRELFPNQPITGIFQPHLFSRTQYFANEFAVSLSHLDHIILLPIYPAREKPIPSVDSQMILNKITNPHKKLIDKIDLLSYLKNLHPKVLLTMGAGDIDECVEWIKKEYS